MQWCLENFFGEDLSMDIFTSFESVGHVHFAEDLTSHSITAAVKMGLQEFEVGEPSNKVNTTWCENDKELNWNVKPVKIFHDFI